MQSQIERVEAAIKDLQAGKMVILTDHPDRENEGDLIAPAQMITPDMMNFMIRQGTGIVCLSMTAEHARKLDLPLMIPAQDNSSFRETPFTISIDAKEGITTGVSSADRAHTVLMTIKDDATAADLVKPGHIFPLQAKKGGVLERQGHTEGSMDLAVLSGFKPAAVLCEIMNQDGTMARGIQLEHFAKQYNLKLLSIDDIIAYRLRHENLIESEISTEIPLDHYGKFNMTVVREKFSGQEHIVLKKKISNESISTLVRVHSSCATGDLFGSQRCDCHKQLHHSLQMISEEGGVLVYLNQEGRGIGLFNKIKAYALQDQGLDTVEANEELGLPVDARSYSIAANILRNLNVNHIRLLTNNPGKVADLKQYGIEISEVVSIPVFHNEFNLGYLKTKSAKLNHSLKFQLN